MLFQSVLTYRWIVKPFTSPLQTCGNTKMKTNHWQFPVKAKWNSPPPRHPGGSRCRQQWKARKKVFLCKFKRVLISAWIAKPFTSPLHIVGNTKTKNNNWPYTRTSQMNIATSETSWRLPSSPIVDKNIRFYSEHSNMDWVPHGSPNPLFHRCK